LIASEISGFDAGNDLKADAPLQLGRGRQRVYWPMEVCYPLQDWINQACDRRIHEERILKRDQKSDPNRIAMQGT